ncbi:hypothetical protein [Tersicoccus sp. Bi-70]|uniref:hypothetical protein n=1 Tax=Tersicoccus sp. Bi-70 TaxID=1897634 RepID=UPI00117C0242|nr:hypothetical protein [Tersicoccus sp. Bi-70]
MASITCKECGHTTTARTLPIAEYGIRRHSCERTRALADAAARAAARRTSSGVRRDCQHKIAHHEHGTRTAYVLDRCRCRPCRDAQAADAAVRARSEAYGRPTTTYVDAEPVRAHLRMLLAHGMGLKTISKQSGISNATFGRMLYGDRRSGRGAQQRTMPHVATAVLAVQATRDTLADGAKVDGTGTTRRLQSLACLGYSTEVLAARLGLAQRSKFGDLVFGRRGVTAGTERKVRVLYNELWCTPAPSENRWQEAAVTRTRNAAAARGWLPPMAWDDDAIDDPEASPSVTVLPTAGRALGGRPARYHHVAEDAEDLLRAGENWETVQSRLGLSANALEKNLSRAGRSDLVTALKNAQDLRGGPRQAHSRRAS